MSRTWHWSRSSMLIHLFRFGVLVAGLFAALAVFFPFYACVKYDVSTLKDALDCPVEVLVYWYVFGDAFLPIYLVPAVVLACPCTVFWAWRDRRKKT